MEETKKQKIIMLSKRLVVMPLLSLNNDEVQFFMSTQVGSFSMIKMQF